MEINYDERSKIGELLLNVTELNKTGYMVFFEESVIAITLEKSFIKETNKAQKKKYKEEGVGFFKRMGKETEYWKNFGERFLYMSIEEITSEFKKVVEINYEDVKKCTLTPYGEDEDHPDGDIIIKSKGAKISFWHSYRKDDPKYQQVLEILGKNTGCLL